MMVLLQEAVHRRNLQITKSARNLYDDITIVGSTDNKYADGKICQKYV